MEQRTHLLPRTVNLRARLLSVLRPANSSIEKGPGSATYWRIESVSSALQELSASMCVLPTCMARPALSYMWCTLQGLHALLLPQVSLADEALMVVSRSAHTSMGAVECLAG